MEWEYVGTAPINKARVVIPKANPARPGKAFEIATKVMGIVKLNTKIPTNPKIGYVAPNANNGAASNKPDKPVLIQPNRSAKIPPNTFPKAIDAVNSINR